MSLSSTSKNMNVWKVRLPLRPCMFKNVSHNSITQVDSTIRRFRPKFKNGLQGLSSWMQHTPRLLMVWFWRSAKPFCSVDLDTLVSWRIPLLLSQSKNSLVSYSPWLSERSVLIFLLVSISSRLKKVLKRACIYRSQFLRQKSHLTIAIEVVIKNYEVSRAIQWPYWHWVDYIWVNDVSDSPSSLPRLIKLFQVKKKKTLV
jgi:hypothetical protein